MARAVRNVDQSPGGSVATVLVQNGTLHVGDTVLIEESRPLSATKRWRLVRVLARLVQDDELARDLAQALKGTFVLLDETERTARMMKTAPRNAKTTSSANAAYRTPVVRFTSAAIQFTPR